MSKNILVKDHLSDIEKLAESVCSGIFISGHFNYVKLRNPSNDLPYHNWYRTCSRVYHSYMGANYYNLPMSSIRAICISALWSEFGHSGGKNHNSIDIKTAIDSYHFYLTTLTSPSLRSSAPTQDPDLRHVPSLMQTNSTVDTVLPFCIEQKILKDVSHIPLMFDTWEDNYLTRYAEEVYEGTGKKMPAKDIINHQIQYIKNIELHTYWASENLNTVLPSRITNLIDKLNFI